MTQNSFSQRRVLRSALVVLAPALLVAVCGIGCGGDESSADTATKSSGPKQGTARITRFEVPESVQCAAGSTSTTVTVGYAAKDASSVRVIVDGRDASLPPGDSGDVDVPVHCDPLPHPVVLYLVDTDGNPTSAQKLVNTVMPGQ